MRVPRLYRTVQITREAIDEDKRTVTFSFSSETPVLRWFGLEVLSHSRDAVDLTRLKASGPHLIMHDWFRQIGVIEDAWIEQKRGWVTVRYSERPEAELEWQDQKAGIRVNVSFGYWPKEMKLLKKKEGEPSTYLVTLWEPFETSNVSVAADITVGHGRSAPTDDEETIECLVREEEDEMDYCPKCGAKMVNGACAACASRSGGQGAIAQLVANADREAAAAEAAAGSAGTGAEAQQRGGMPLRPEPQTLRIEVSQPGNTHSSTPPGGEAQQTPQDVAARILEVGAAYRQTDLAMASVRNGHTMEQFQAELFRALRTSGVLRPVNESDSDLGMSQRDVSRYRLLNLVRHLADPGNRSLEKAAGFELECSRAYQKIQDASVQPDDDSGQRVLNRESGVQIPPDILRAPISREAVVRGAMEMGLLSGAVGSQRLATLQRAFEVGDNDAGGYLVDTTTLYTSMIGYMWKAIHVGSLCTRLTGLRGNIQLPKEIGEADAYWIAEDGSTTETSGENMFGMVGAVARTVGIQAAITRKLMMQSSLDVEMWYRAHLGRKHGSEFERVLINGSGVNGEPFGVLNTPGIGSVTFGGAAVTWAKIIELWTDIAGANAPTENVAFLTNALVAGQCLVTPRVSGHPVMITNEDFKILVYPLLFTNHVPANLGGGSNRSAMIAGNFSDLVLCQWGGWDLVRDATSSSTAQLILKSYMDVDTVVRQLGSFSAGTDIAA
jgi:HK97 family phage major capsid protein